MCPLEEKLIEELYQYFSFVFQGGENAQDWKACPRLSGEIFEKGKANQRIAGHGYVVS